MEIEFKNLLTTAEYKRLFEAYKFGELTPVVQENLYFDTSDMTIKENQSALRIRMKEHSAEMTLKTPKNGHLLETNEDLTLSEAEEMIKAGTFTPPDSILNQLKSEGVTVDTVHLVTSLKTKRYEKEVNGCLIVLDQSWYGNTMDYELELEAPEHDKGKEMFYTILLENKIKERSTPNKIARAYQHVLGEE